MSPRPHLPQPGLLARLFGSRRLHELQARAQAMDRVQAVVEFELDGTLRHANRNFLELFGYRLEEIRGQHHRLFVPVAERESAAYRGLWGKLGRGEFDAGRYRRIAKDGRTLWIQASYNPILDARGRPRGVIKFATDISAQMLHEADVSGQLAAINRSMAVIEFALDGTILHANPNFLRALGYQEHEVVGQHHRLFVDATTRDSAAYREFWARLAQGEHQSGSFHRIGKGGREVWIEASYSPILDPEGRPFKVVKYAADITEQVLRRADFESQIAALRKVQAVIEFELDGSIRDANPAFLEAVGYRLDEIRGQHHRLFVDPAEAASPAYRAFWEKLGRGEFDRGEYRRLAKGGREIWLQASYNPILTPEGRPYKVVKFALDVTAKVRLAASLRQLVQRMDGLAAQISQASAEIAQGNADLASRTEHQAGNIAATAGAMQTLTATVRRNADDTQQANQLTLETADVARAGGEVMQGVVTTMHDIHASSRRIADIIGVIDGIAFQTNILALNAAVEAARAGEQGRGFAVVASEVRSLAQRCAEAAKDIKSLISQSNARVEQGSREVDRAGQSMQDILARIDQVSALMRSMAAASDEQRRDIEQIGDAVEQMDQSTQQNAAMVEEIAAAARLLDQESSELSATVSDFIRSNGLERG